MGFDCFVCMVCVRSLLSKVMNRNMGSEDKAFPKSNRTECSPLIHCAQTIIKVPNSHLATKTI